MKFLHISDLHIGSPMTTHLAPRQVTERTQEIIETFERSVKFGVERGVDAVLIAGDLFDNSEIGPRKLARVREVIRSNKNIPFFYVSGNHEGQAFEATGAVLENFYTFTDTFSYYDLGDVRIHGANKTAPDMFSSLEIDRTKKNIVLLHGEWGDHSNADGTIGLREVEGLGVDYLALGHYHSFDTREISGGGIAVYSGTPEGRGFDEAGEKGVVIFDSINCKPQFYPMCKRTIHVIEVNTKGAKSEEEVIDRANTAIEGIPSRDLVQMIMVGELDTTISLGEEFFTSLYKSKFWYFDWKNKTKIAIYPEDLKHDRSIQGEFIRQVIADKTLSEEDIRDIIECGILAMKGVEWK